MRVEVHFRDHTTRLVLFPESDREAMCLQLCTEARPEISMVASVNDSVTLEFVPPRQNNS
jgi:hypothetical protein